MRLTRFMPLLTRRCFPGKNPHGSRDDCCTQSSHARYFWTCAVDLWHWGSTQATSISSRKAGLGWPDDEVDVTVDVSSTFDAKQKALLCHQTQFGPSNPLRQLPEETTRQMMSQEHFALA